MNENASQHKPDARLNVFRPDLAAESLRGLVEAKRYVTGAKRSISASVAAMRAEPSDTASLVNEALFGEVVWVYEDNDGWCWCQLARDNYVGYIASEAVGPELDDHTHRVAALGTFVYPEPNIKAPTLMHLSLNSPVTVTGTEGSMCVLSGGGFVVSRHILDKDRFARDFVEVAERFIGTPYLWGGRSRIGVDCSGLIQLAMEAAGFPSPRDSDMQYWSLGDELSVTEDLDGLQRGDLLFWDGHVGVMTDGVMLLHANAFHMAAVVEPAVSARTRIEKEGSPLLGIKRPASLAG